MTADPRAVNKLNSLAVMRAPGKQEGGQISTLQLRISVCVTRLSDLPFRIVVKIDSLDNAVALTFPSTVYLFCWNSGVGWGERGGGGRG